MNEETRQSERVAEAKQAGVDGGAKRLDNQRVEEVNKLLTKPTPKIDSRPSQ